MCFVNDELCISQKVSLQTHRWRSTLLLNNLIFPKVEEINVTCSNYTIHTLSVLTRDLGPFLLPDRICIFQQQQSSCSQVEIPLLCFSGQ